MISDTAARPLRRTFRGEPGQVPQARDFVRRYLTGPGCPTGTVPDIPAPAVQDILVCASELATNAVLHSRSGHPGGYFSVEIAVHDGRWVHVAVEDSGGPWAERDPDDGYAESGRGLYVVAELAADMGITGDASGRTAWFRSRWDAGEDDRNVYGTFDAHPRYAT